MPRLRSLFCALLMAALAVPAIAGPPSVERISPGVGQRGSEFELRLIGAGLSSAEETLLYTTAISQVGLQIVSDNEAMIRLKAADDCPVGRYPFRIRTREGVSELHTFVITAMPVVLEAEPNNSRDEAQKAVLNVAVAGILESDDHDVFQVSLRRGDRLAAEVEGVRAGGAILDTVLKVEAPDGRALATVDDTSLFHQDPFVTLLAPEDGVYTITVRETNSEGDENSRYVLHVGSFPRPSFAFPPGGPAGETTTVTFHGDAAGPFQADVSLPASSVGDYPLFATHRDLVSPTALRFRVSAFPNVNEPQQSAAALPSAFNGILEQTGTVDQFLFDVADSEPWEFESFAYRLGSSADTVLTITDEAGIELVSNDDDGSHDSRLLFTPPKPGRYTLQVSDKRKSGGPDSFYRVETARPAPQLTAFLARPDRLSQNRQTISVPQGNRVVTFLAVQRQRFAGDVRLSGSGLPAGVLFSDTMIDADRFWMPVVVEASADAPIAGRLTDVVASGASNGEPVTGNFRQVVDVLHETADALFQSAVVNRLAVAVVEKVPFALRLEPARTALVQNGTLTFVVHVDRESGFKNAVNVTFPFLPPWVDGPSEVTVPEGESHVEYTMRAHPDAEVRTWRICAEGRAAGARARRGRLQSMPGAESLPEVAPPPDTAVCTQLIELNVAESPVDGSFGAVVAEQGVPLNVACIMDVHGELPETMVAELEGLPNRVTSSSVTIRRDATHIEFQVIPEPTAPLGSFPDLVCRLTGQFEGQTVSYCIGRGGVLRIEPRGSVVTDEQGAPLSRLQILQKQQADAASAE